MARASNGRRALGFAVIAAAIALAYAATRDARAAALVLTPDTPDPRLSPAAAADLERARALAPSNAVYRYWTAQQLQASMRARWLEGETAVQIGRRALDEADAAVTYLEVNADFHVGRAEVLLELARHPMTPADERRSLVERAAADLERALELRVRSPILVSRLADLMIRRWHEITPVRPELPVRVLRHAATMQGLGRIRLYNAARLDELWRVLMLGNATVEQAIGVLESVVPADVAPLQRYLARVFRTLARRPRTGATAARDLEALEEAAARAATRAEIAEPFETASDDDR